MELSTDEECEHGMPFWLGCECCDMLEGKQIDLKVIYISFGKVKEVTRQIGFTQQWQHLRKQVFAAYGKTCMRCGATEELGTSISVDHIYPRSLYPEKTYDFQNLQVLCGSCNSSKSNRYVKDYRE